MTDADRQLILLLPERRRFSGQALALAVAKSLARGDWSQAGAAGEQAQLLRYFQMLPRGWPMAAITRQGDAGDAAGNAWLRVDPVFVRPDMTGARLMAWGNLGLSTPEAEEFIAPLRPIFGDAGFPISAGAPERWYLMLPRDVKLPAFSAPTDGLGEDLLAHLPEGPEGRRWRALLNEAQVILHNHPRNSGRIAAGKVPVNSLWFWGGGVLPDAVNGVAESVLSEDEELLALAKCAGASNAPREKGNALIDLRRARDWAALEQGQLRLALESLKKGEFRSVVLDFSDGASVRLEAGQRWRLWRRPLAKLAA
jgi:hypothetical protein